MIPFENTAEMSCGLSQANYESASRHYAPDIAVSREQILEDLALSRRQEKEGKHRRAREAFDEVMAEYGLNP